MVEQMKSSSSTDHRKLVAELDLFFDKDPTVQTRSHRKRTIANILLRVLIPSIANSSKPRRTLVKRRWDGQLEYQLEAILISVEPIFIPGLPDAAIDW